MNILRKIERNQLKKEYKQYNKGISKKYRKKFNLYWKAYKAKKGEKADETS